MRDRRISIRQIIIPKESEIPEKVKFYNLLKEY